MTKKDQDKSKEQPKEEGEKPQGPSKEKAEAGEEEQPSKINTYVPALILRIIKNVSCGMQPGLTRMR
jgi:hypothetical protein